MVGDQDSNEKGKQMDAVQNFEIDEITLQEIDFDTESEMIAQLYAMWAKDYRAAGDFCASPAIPIDKLFSSADRFFIAYKDSVLAGLLILRQERSVWTIKVVYVAPKFRKQGVATELYDVALSELGASEIEISYKRVLKRVGYWQARGFKSLKGKIGHGYSYNELCFLSTMEHSHSMRAVPLELNAINRYRQRLGCTYEFKASLA